ncbi:MAG: efflux RND transporter permease subunit [Candidatus Sumerlaeia bacterium]|nr:efflux RND transporter permease subunit [Candidatus Sumerlaeia bacterium]
MKLITLAIRQGTTVLVFMTLMALVGINAYRTMPREAAPDITIPYITVTTRYEGVSPSDIESLVTRPIERKLKGLSKVKEMRSMSAEGISTIMVEFDISENLDTALQRVKDKVDMAKADLPADADDPVVAEINISELPIMFVSISGDVGLVKLKQIADDLEDKIDPLPGVLDASVVGGLEREIHVEFDPDRLAAYQLSATELIQSVRASNLNMPGGSLKIGEAKYTLKVPAEFANPAEINNIVLAVRNGKPIYLTDICTIEDGYKDRESYARIDGKECVTLVVVKRSGENLLRLADMVKDVLRTHVFPPGVKVAITADASKMVRNMVADLENNMLSALVLVVGVIVVALNFRSALFVATAIPFSIFIALAILNLFGVTLNMIVLFSLVLVLGMLVDCAIVVVENVYRHYSMGKTRIQAAHDGASEMAGPVIGSTLTTVGAFTPLLFWPDVIGKFMSYLPMTVIIALMASMFIALVFNPVLCGRWMGQPGPGEESLESRLRRSRVLRAYRVVLSWSLRHRFVVISCSFLTLFLTIFAYGKWGTGVIFFPETDPNRAYIDLKAPEGTRLEVTDRLVRPIEKMLTEYRDIEHFTTNVGPHGTGSNPFEGGGGSEPNQARIVIDFVDAEYRTSSSAHIVTEIRERLRNFVGAEIKVEKEQHGPPTGAPVNIEISGDDYDVLAGLAAQIQEKIRNVDALVDLRDDYVVGRPEIKVLIDRERAALFNLTAAEIAYMVRTAMSGSKVGVYREGEDEYDIIVRLPERLRRLDPETSPTAAMANPIAMLERLRISDRMGNQIPLTSVADIRTTSGLSTIRRIDQKRTVTVTANVVQRRGRTNEHVRQDVSRILSTLQLPAGYSVTLTGEQKEQQKASQFLSKAFIVALFLIAMVIVAEFNSLMQTLIIMTSVILSLIGVLWGLIITQHPFSVIMTGLGVISLAGVVVNNAIVMLDYTQLLRSWGRSKNEALVEAGLTRFRPVMLTAVTASLGLFPTAVGVAYDFLNLRWSVGTESSQWWAPMATAVVFGLLVATVLTLVVVPTTYSVVESALERLKRLFRRAT